MKNKNIVISVCVLLISSLINTSSSLTLILPKPKGFFGVGTINVELTDPSRTQLRNNEKRRFIVTVFYPTIKVTKLHPYMPGTLTDGIVCGVKIFGYSVPHEPIIESQKFPVVISFPGRGGERQKETILYEALASHGYIVITLDQPYVANFVRFSDGAKITLTLKDIWKIPRDRDYRYKYDDEIIDSAMKDVDLTLQNLYVFGQLAASFDSSKIILMGHSIGGNIANIKGFADSRIKAVVDIDSKITERKIFGYYGPPSNNIGKPVLFIRGMMQYQEDVGDRLKKIHNHTIWSPMVQHSAFSDDAYFAAKIPSYGMNFCQGLYNWFFKIGPFFSDIDTGLGNYNVDDWFEEYPDYVVRWLDRVTK